MVSKDSPPRTVIDTNILVSALIVEPGNPNRLLRAWQKGAVHLMTAPILIAELDRTLHLPRIRQKYAIREDDVTQLLEALQAVEQVVPLGDLPISSRDVHDNPLLAVALGGAAQYLVTGDQDLLVLNGHPALGALQIVPVQYFLTVMPTLL